MSLFRGTVVSTFGLETDSDAMLMAWGDLSNQDRLRLLMECEFHEMATYGTDRSS